MAAILSPSMLAYEDDFLLIIDKPAGMLVHPTVSERGTTLYDYVKAYYEANGINAGIHPVSRLDRNTSGLVVFAKEPVVQHWLSQQQVEKEYLALACGCFDCSEGIIEAPIARKEGSIIERCVDYERGKHAKTAYEVLASYSNHTLLKVRLFTGRTHQIRVHLASIGHPLVNDNLYGTPGPQARHALHAYRLAFKHPVSDVFLEITRALPEDLQKLLY
ncbi:RNA pseudouridine synthase [Phascolarctobacterium succinatutens]|uniref:RluA family pseudouridine synthase n=1 Tax=Phascolarctobacterium succinatutens TaxID=626940 RepID=UPI003076D2DD